MWTFPPTFALPFIHFSHRLRWKNNCLVLPIIPDSSKHVIQTFTEERLGESEKEERCKRHVTVESRSVTSPRPWTWEARYREIRQADETARTHALGIGSHILRSQFLSSERQCPGGTRSKEFGFISNNLQ